LGGGTLNVQSSLHVANEKRIDAAGNGYLNQIELPSGITVGECTSSPDGVETAPLGSIRIETTSGAVYLKGEPIGNTGWEQLATQADLTAGIDDVIAAAEFPIYAEGTFTPTFTCETPDTLSYTPGTTTGAYTRIGNRVSARIRLEISNLVNGTNTAGEVRIGFADMNLVPSDDLGHGRLIRKSARIYIPKLGVVGTQIGEVITYSNLGEEPLYLEMSMKAGQNYATITYSSRLYGPETVSQTIDDSNVPHRFRAFPDFAGTTVLDTVLEFYV
jgi:hypothetical protein